MGKSKHPYRDPVTLPIADKGRFHLSRGATVIIGALLVLLACPALFAGGGRHNVLVVVNDNSAVSLAVGDYYARARNIPSANVCHINCTTGESIDSAGLKDTILYPIESYLSAHGLVDQIQYIVLTKGIPLVSRTTDCSVDSSLSLAFERSSDGLSPCIEPAGSPYVSRESDFAAYRDSDANKIEWSAPRQFKDIAPRGDGTIFAVGGHFIARSANGVDWEQIPEDGRRAVQASLSRAFFLDNAHGWAVGDRDTILRTTDGGSTWQRVRGGPSSPRVALTAVWFASATDGWVVGRDQSGGPTVLHSGDGGVTWDPQPTDATAPLHDIFFTDDRHGWIVGDEDMLRTIDGGASWISARNGVPGGTLNRIFFADADNGWVVGGMALLCRTTDGGNTWVRQTIPGMYGQSLLDCHFIDRDKGWIVTDCAYDDPEQESWSGRLMRTTDGGVTWSTLQTGENDRHAVYFADAKSGWYTQGNSDEEPWENAIYKTTDGGAGRTRVYASPPWNVRLRYLVCRLDAYGADTRNGGNGVPDDIEDMVSGSLAPDTTGRFVIDASTGNYLEGNASLADAAARLLNRGKSVLLDQNRDFITGSYPGIGAIAGYAGWGSNDGASKWNTEWGKPNFAWKPGSIAMCYVSRDGRSFIEPPSYLGCASNMIVDEGIECSDPGVIEIYNWVYAGWVAKLHDAEGAVLSSASFTAGSIYLPCATPVEGYIQVYRPDGATPICGGRFPASGPTRLAGGKAYKYVTEQSLIADYLSEGCSAAIGSVAEPGFGCTFPEYTFPRYVDGYTWAESAYMGIAVVPYTFVVVGDPLMAPYATPPSVAIASPGADGTSLKGAVEIEVTATDAQGISRVELWVDDRYHSAASGPGPVFRLALDTRALSDGPHTLEAIAYEAGKVATQAYALRTVVVANTPDSVADLFDVTDGTEVHLESGTVTRAFPSLGCAYVQEGQSAGIRVVCAEIPAEGDVVELEGILHTGGGIERQIVAGSLTVLCGCGTIPRALGMSNRSLGGKTLGTASGISRRSRPVGLYNIGLLVESWGRITDIGPDYFLISDGSDGDVKVRCCGFDLPFYWPNDYIKVTGISSTEDGNRALLVNKADDIRLMSSASP